MPKQQTRNIGKIMSLRKARADAEGREFFFPVRTVIVKSPVRILRELHSVKMRTYLPCESAIEFDHATVLDVRPDVIRILAQPETVFYELDGKQRRTVPDFRIDLADGTTELHECRTDKEAALERTQRETVAIARACMVRRVRYVEMTESTVRREPRLSNARLLRDVRMRPRSAAVERSVADLLRVRGAMALRELCTACEPHEAIQADILAMTLRGLVALDWEHTAIGPDIEVAPMSRVV